MFHRQFLINYVFYVSLKLAAGYIKCQWGKLIINNVTLCLHVLFWHFLFVFHQKTCVWNIFISFFDEILNFLNRILTNKKLDLVIINYQWNWMVNQNSCIIGFVLIYHSNFYYTFIDQNIACKSKPVGKTFQKGFAKILKIFSAKIFV